ncbi:MAG: hypothetical protein LBB51_05130 [Zoogloeaceae bacterium]|jgi:hypothetical protein|nr:hypothetical protein [Zoogloeaceae bacterium]
MDASDTSASPGNPSRQQQEASHSGNMLDMFADSASELGDTALKLAGHAVDVASHTLSALADGI